MLVSNCCNAWSLAVELLCLILLLNATTKILGDDKRRPSKSDVVVVFDQSDSVDDQSFDEAKNLLNRFVRDSSVSPETKRIAVIGYGDSAVVHSHLDTSYNRDHLLNTVQSLRSKTGSGGFQHAIKLLFDILRYKTRRKVPRIVILLSNGLFHWPSYSSLLSKKLEIMKVRRFVFGIGKYINSQFLINFASRPYHSHAKRLKPYSNIDELVEKLPDVSGKYSECTIPRFDECNRRCQCVNGVLSNCTRVRKEFTQLTTEERIRYVTNYKWLTSLPEYTDQYISFIAMHRVLFMNLIHHADHFLPWHRWYVYAFENMIRQLDCRITIPYWDWTYWSPIAFSMDKHIWRNAPDWFGGNGNLKNDRCVETGPFAESQWKLPEYENFRAERKTTFWPERQSGFHKRCLRRGFSGTPANRASLAKVLALNLTQYNMFDHYLRFGYHAELHCLVGGTMCTLWAGNCPEFFLHHSFLDKIWHMWQKKGKAYKEIYFKGLRNATMERSPFYQDDLYDNDSQPYAIRIDYTEFYDRATQDESSFPVKDGLSSTVDDELIAAVGYSDDENMDARNAAKDLFGITDQQDSMTKKIRELLRQT